MTKPAIALISWGILAIAGNGTNSTLGAQSPTLLSPVNTSQTVPSPTAATYDAPAPNNATGPNTTANFSVTLQCDSGHSCHMTVALGTAATGGPLAVQWKLVNVDNAAKCNNPTINAQFAPVTTTPTTVIIGVSKKDSCTATFQFQVAGLSYADVHTPGAAGAPTVYVQGVTFAAVDN